MEVAHSHAELAIIVGEIFGHALGERGHQDAFLLFHALPDFRKEIVHLAGDWTHEDFGIHEPRRANDLLDDDALGAFQLVIARRRGNEERLPHVLLEFLEAQGPVVERARKAEPVLDQGLFARAVAAVHRAELGDRLMRLVDDEQEILGEIVDERGGGLARNAPGEMSRVVLDPLAEPHLLHHLEVVHGALFEALLLEEPARLVVKIETFAQLGADRLDGGAHLLLGRHVVRPGVDGVAVDLAFDLAAQGVDLFHRFDLVAEEFDANGGLVLVDREHLDDVATHAERAAVKVDVVALVLNVHQTPQELVAPKFFPFDELDEKPVVALGRTDAIDAADGRDDDDIAPRQERLRRRVPHAIDLIVDDGIFVDEGIGGGNVRFGLVVVVIADEVLNGVVGKEVAHLAIELRGERLVGSQDQGRLLRMLDDVGNAERLTRPRDPQQNLARIAAVEAATHLLDGPRLIATRHEVRNEFQGTGH